MKASFTTLAGWHDVFHEILSHLDPIDSDYNVDDDKDCKIYITALHTCRRATLSLALSCRAFLDPSLNKLWRGLDDIHNLLKLLPNYQRRDDDSTYHVTGEISSEAWARLQTYATRVRSICLSSKTTIDPLTWDVVLEKCQGAFLFPNLRILHTRTHHATLESLSPIRRLASPSLRHLFLSINKDQHTDKSTISTLLGLTLQECSMKSPGLVWLYFFPYMNIGYEHLACLSRFTKMERLHLSDRAPLDEAILLSLVNLPNLTHLHAHVRFQDSTVSTAGRLDIKDCFQKLTILDLHCRPTSLARFMLASSMPRLNNLQLRLRPHLADAFHSSFSSICRHIGPHMLTKFRVELGDFLRPPRHLMDLLEPLLPFANLREVEVLFEPHLPLRNEDLERLARAWPKLHVLILAQSEFTIEEPDHVPGSVERPTLHGLVALAQGCPRLTKISIPDLDATSVPPVDSVPLAAHRARKLCIQNLVGAGEDERQLAVAVVLDRLFPRLRLEPCGFEELPGYGGSPNNVYLADSKNVSLLLRAMQLARSHYQYPGGVQLEA